VIKIKTILFDLGNVLAYIDFTAFWHELGFLQEQESSRYADGYKIWTRQYETGFISTHEYLQGLRTVFNKRFTNERLEHAFGNILLEPVDGMMDIVRRVSRTHQTALVSNTNEIHYAASLKKFEVLGLLHQHYLSYRLHVMKPAQGFYNAIIKDQKINSAEMLFIDDLPVNVEGARAAGMHAVQFENTAQLESVLKSLDVL
jgi:HAD superfamily hydrolase (TIGR01509 family)